MENIRKLIDTLSQQIGNINNFANIDQAQRKNFHALLKEIEKGVLEALRDRKYEIDYNNIGLITCYSKEYMRKVDSIREYLCCARAILEDFLHDHNLGKIESIELGEVVKVKVRCEALNNAPSSLSCKSIVSHTSTQTSSYAMICLGDDNTKTLSDLLNNKGATLTSIEMDKTTIKKFSFIFAPQRLQSFINKDFVDTSLKNKEIAMIQLLLIHLLDTLNVMDSDLEELKELNYKELLVMYLEQDLFQISSILGYKGEIYTTLNRYQITKKQKKGLEEDVKEGLRKLCEEKDVCYDIQAFNFIKSKQAPCVEQLGLKVVKYDTYLAETLKMCIEDWVCDEDGKVHIAITPTYSNILKHLKEEDLGDIERLKTIECDFDTIIIDDEIEKLVDTKKTRESIMKVFDNQKIFLESICTNYQEGEFVIEKINAII